MIDKSIREFVVAFQSGSREAFAKLVQHYQNLVTSVALARTGDLQRSEDIAQQAFLVAWQKQGELQDPDRFSGWIRGIAHNLARNERRLKVNVVERREAKPVEGPSEPTAKTEAPDYSTSRLEQSELLWSMVDHIPEDYREPLILFYREDKSVAVVAEQMGLSESAVKQRLKRGRSMLKQEIEVRVEQMLDDTKPNQAFAAGVLAALPSAASVGTAVAKAGLFSGLKAGITKLFAMIGAGATMGIIFGALGSLLGAGGAWWGTKKAASMATSEQEKTLLWNLFRKVLVLAIAFSILIYLSVAAAGPFRVVLLVATVTGYVFGLTYMINRFNKRQKQLHAKYGKPDYMNQSQPQSVSTTVLRINALATLVGVWSWIIIFTAIRRSFLVMGIALAVLISHMAWVWITAPANTTAAKQIRFNGRLCFWGCICQVAVMITGLLIGEPQFALGWQGVSIWAMCGLILALGLFLGVLLTIKANQLEKTESDSSTEDTTV